MSYPTNALDGFKLEFIKSEYRSKIAEKEYRSHDALNQSFFKDINSISPFYAEYAMKNREEATPAMRIGSLFHSLSLEPNKVKDEYAMLPEGIDRRTKDGKLAHEEFMSLNGHKIILKSDEWELANNMADAAHVYLPYGIVPEATMFGDILVSEGMHKGTVLNVKARFDAMMLNAVQTEDGNVTIYDLKSVADISDCKGASWASNWAIQAALYHDMAAMAYQRRVQFIYICVSKKAPFDVRRFMVTQEMLAKGRNDYTRAISKWVWYINNGRPRTQSFYGLEELNA